MTEPIRVDICEGEAGMIVAMFLVPPQNNSERLSILESAVTKWLEPRSLLRVSEVVKLRHFDKLYGLAVYLTREHSEAFTPLQAVMSPALLQSFSFEYIESVATAATVLACDKGVPHDYVLMVNRREVAMIVDRDAWRVTIGPFDEAAPLLSEEQLEDFDIWLEGDDVGFFVAALPREPPAG